MDVIMSTDVTADDVADSPYKILYPIGLLVALVIGIIYAVTMLDSQMATYRQQQFQQGIRRGLKLYATQYDLSNTGLQRLSEGYLMKDDLDGLYGYRSLLSDPNYKLDTNALLVDKSRAKNYFDEMLRTNHYDKADVSSYKYYIINISCTYSSSNEFNTSFAVEIMPHGNPSSVYDSTGNSITTTQGVVNFIQNYGDFKAKGIKLDLAKFHDGRSANGVAKSLKDKLDNSVRVSQYYSRTNPLNVSNSKDTVSTLNMYMCIGIDIPIKGIFKTYSKNFCEVQSYTTVRTGEGGVNQK